MCRVADLASGVAAGAFMCTRSAYRLAVATGRAETLAEMMFFIGRFTLIHAWPIDAAYLPMTVRPPSVPRRRGDGCDLESRWS